MDKSKEDEFPRYKRRTVIQSEKFKEWQQELFHNRFIYKRKTNNALETTPKKEVDGEKGERGGGGEGEGEGEEKKEEMGENKDKKGRNEKKEGKKEGSKQQWMNFKEGYHLRSTTNSLKLKKMSPKKAISQKLKEEIYRKKESNLKNENILKRKYERRRIEKDYGIRIRKMDSKIIQKTIKSKANTSNYHIENESDKEKKENDKLREGRKEKGGEKDDVKNNEFLDEKSNLSLCSKKAMKKNGLVNTESCDKKYNIHSLSEDCNMINKKNQENDCGESRETDSCDWRKEYALNREIRSKRNAEKLAEVMKKEENWLSMAKSTPTLKVTLTKEEIREDFLKITGKTCSAKPKKSTLISKGLALGLCLTEPNWYKY